MLYVSDLCPKVVDTASGVDDSAAPRPPPLGGGFPRNEEGTYMHIYANCRASHQMTPVDVGKLSTTTARPSAPPPFFVGRHKTTFFVTTTCSLYSGSSSTRSRFLRISHSTVSRGTADTKLTPLSLFFFLIPCSLANDFSICDASNKQSQQPTSKFEELFFPGPVLYPCSEVKIEKCHDSG